MPLLVLSAERIEQELQRVNANAAADRAWRRQLLFTIGHAALWWVGGLLLVLSSFHWGGRPAQAVFAAGWFVGNVAPIAVLAAGWLRAQE